MEVVFYASIIALGGLGLMFGAGLAFASKKFAVEVDPKVEQIIDILPGANCGACGYPGCSAYAEAVVEGKAPPNKCTPGGEEVSQKIATIVGITQVESAEAKVAVIRCQGGRDQAVEKFKYIGIKDCHAALLVGGGHKACPYGCLGLGSCAQACPFDAIEMNKNGLPVVIENKCTGCGICVQTCPRNIIELIPRSQKVYLACVSQDRLKEVKSICKVGCFACKLCTRPKVTPEGSIEMDGNLPLIKKIHNDKELFAAHDKCPANCYVIRGQRADGQKEDEEKQKAESVETEKQ